MGFQLEQTDQDPFDSSGSEEEEEDNEDCLSTEDEETTTLLPGLSAHMDTDSDNSGSICSPQFEPLSDIES